VGERRNRALGAVLVAEVVSMTGTEMTAVALPWFVLVTTGSPARMAGVMSAEFVGTAFLGIPSGRLAHALGPRRTMLIADAGRAPLLGLVPLLYAVGGLSYAVLLAVGFAVGACFPAYSSSQRLVVASVVGDDEVALTRIGGVLGAVNETASFVGPALGGALVAVIGASAVLAVDAVTYVVSFAILALAIPRQPRPPDEEGAGDLLAGLRWLWRDSAIRRQILAVMVVELGWTALMAALPVAARHRYDGGAALAGWFVGAYGGGSIIGGLISARTKRIGMRTATLAMVVIAALSWVMVPRVPAWAVIACVAGTGVCNQIYFPRLFAALTVAPPVALRTQVMTAAMTAASVTGPIGFVVAGLLIDGRPVTGAFVVVAVAASVAATISVWPRSDPVASTR
jgi:MFS family permease